MRCHFLSDLHLESQAFPWKLPAGDVLIVAGDLCHACCLGPARTDPYAISQRERALRFVENATASFAHVLLIAGNHDHYDGVFEDTIQTLRTQLPGVTVLDDEAVAIDGVSFFGTTLWTDFEGRSDACMNGLRRGVGEFFFVKTRSRDADGTERLAKFRPQDALVAHDRSIAALKRHLASAGERKTVVITHHAPSRQGLNALHIGNGLDGAYASDLDAWIAALANVPVWVHGHTHIQKTYRIGETTVHANCRGFEKRDPSAHRFRVDRWFDLSAA